MYVARARLWVRLYGPVGRRTLALSRSEEGVLGGPVRKMTGVGKVDRYISLWVTLGWTQSEGGDGGGGRGWGPCRVYCIDDSLWEGASGTQQKGPEFSEPV